MSTLKSLCLELILLVVVIFGLTTAVPQWHNSTDGRQYLIEGEQKYNWFHAHHECARKNLQLVEIDSHDKNQALLAVLNSIFGNSHNLWLGANDEYNRDKSYGRPFYWSSSGKPMTFSYWSNNNPDNDRNYEHCVHTWNSAPDFRWNDIQCDSPRFGFICEEHYIKETACKSIAEKQKTLSQTMAKLFRDYQEQQKQQMEKLDNALKDIATEETDLKEVVHNIQTKLEFDITHALSQHQREINSVVEARNKKISGLNLEMRSATEVMSKNFAKELEAVQNIVNELARV